MQISEGYFKGPKLHLSASPKEASETKGSINAPPWKRGLRFSSSLGPESTSVRECGAAHFFPGLPESYGLLCDSVMAQGLLTEVCQEPVGKLVLCSLP